MAQPPAVSIVIPIFNEAETLASATQRLLSALYNCDLAAEVILAENGSQDATLAVAQELAYSHPNLRVIHREQPDYGRAMRQGFLCGEGKYLVNFSIDCIDMDFLSCALALLANGPANYDLVLGSKYVAASYDRRGVSRRLPGLMLSGLARLLFALPVADTHGLLAMRSSRLRPLIERCRSGNEIFDTELIVRAHRARLAMREIPFHVEEVRPPRQGNARRALRMLRHLGELRLALWREGIR